MEFQGFYDNRNSLISLPEQFFTQLLPAIDDIVELKVVLYIFYHVNRSEGMFRYIRLSDFEDDEEFMNSLDMQKEIAHVALQGALAVALEQKILLKAELESQGKCEQLYFINSPKGKAAIQAIEQGKWRIARRGEFHLELGSASPNIYQLYEENIGPITPMIAESLRDAEQNYDATWIEDALRIAVNQNARNWRYVSAILERWKEEGRVERKDRPDSEKARRKYAEWDRGKSSR